MGIQSTVGYRVRVQSTVGVQGEGAEYRVQSTVGYRLQWGISSCLYRVQWGCIKGGCRVVYTHTLSLGP